jgi:flagella basal body P-ring formation protein FlgA
VRNPFVVSLLAALVLGHPTRAHAQMDPQPLDAIRAAALAALGSSDGEANVGADMRMHRCAQPLQAVASGARTALVRCPDTPGWHLYVPVRLHHEADVVVLRTPAPVGVALSAEQLVVQRRDLDAAAGMPITDPSGVVGRRPTRALAAGAVLSPADLSQGPALKRGDPVMLVTRVGSVEVRAGGRALGPGSADGLVAAENVESHRVVRGRMAAPGIIEVLQ